MRRKDRQITDILEVEGIIRQAAVCHFAMVDDGAPYIVPMNYGYSDGALYFHSAPEGRKIEILRRNPHVSFSLVAEAEIVSTKNPCGWTTRYRSVTGSGKATMVEDNEGKREGLKILMAQFSDKVYEFGDGDLGGLIIIRVDIEEMVAKVSD